MDGFPWKAPYSQRLASIKNMLTPSMVAKNMWTMESTMYVKNWRFDIISVLQTLIIAFQFALEPDGCNVMEILIVKGKKITV